MSGSGCEVDVVVTCTGTNHNLQLLGSVKYFGVNLVRTDNQSVGILHSVQQLSLLRIFLQQGELMAACFYLFANALDSCCCERLLCCN